MPTTGLNRIPPPSQRSQQAVEALVVRLQLILCDVRRYKHLLGCKESDAQNILDVFQWLLDTPQLDTRFRCSLIVAAQRLSTKSGLYPVCYELKGVVQLTEHPVACGGFADIYKGEFQGQVVCIKAIRVYETTEVEHILKQFSKEAILWGQLSHLNVLPVYGLYRFRGQLCLVAPWMGNNDINKYLKQNPNAPRRRLADDVAHGLKYLHENGVIHGDLKGPNILIDDDGRACVADFGISSISDPEILAWTSHSSVGSKGGSVRWQAPELFDMENDELVKNSVASDVYAWACVCLEIFTGTVPFPKITLDASVILQVKLGARPTRPAPSSPAWGEWGLTETIWYLMEDSWSQNPAKRPTMAEIISRLSPELGGDKRMRRSVLSAARFRERAVRPLDSATMTAFDGILLAVTMGKMDGDLTSPAVPELSHDGLPSPPLSPPPLTSLQPEVMVSRGSNRIIPARVRTPPPIDKQGEPLAMQQRRGVKRSAAADLESGSWLWNNNNGVAYHSNKRRATAAPFAGIGRSRRYVINLSDSEGEEEDGDGDGDSVPETSTKPQSGHGHVAPRPSVPVWGTILSRWPNPLTMKQEPTPESKYPIRRSVSR